jgi:hypothetical protein
MTRLAIVLLEGGISPCRMDVVEGEKRVCSEQVQLVAAVRSAGPGISTLPFLGLVVV